MILKFWKISIERNMFRIKILAIFENNCVFIHTVQKITKDKVSLQRYLWKGEVNFCPILRAYKMVTWARNGLI